VLWWRKSGVQGLWGMEGTRGGGGRATGGGGGTATAREEKSRV